MNPDHKPGTKARVAPAGLFFLAITSIGWGFNWPITKFLLSYLPPLTLRGTTGVVGASLLAVLALLRGQSLRVPRQLWGRLVLAAFLNVGCWMVLMGFALLFLSASEAALIAYTMPVWASILAWPILGERPNLLRVISLVMAFAGLSAILGGNGFAASLSKLPGIIMALGGAIGFAVGAVLAKKLPVNLPPVSAAAWQVGIGDRWTGQRFDKTVPTPKAIEPASAMMMPGNFAALAEMPLPPMIAASPAKAITSAIVRNSVGRSPSTGQARSEAQTGMV